MIDAAANPTAVDPAILSDALAHIARVAGKSRTASRRTRWIQQRAEKALAGELFTPEALDVPRDPGPDTVVRLKHKARTMRRLATTLTDVLQRLDRFADEVQAPADSEAAQLASAIKHLTGDALARAIVELTPPAEAGTEQGNPHAHD